MMRDARRLTALVAGVLLLSGCGFRGAYSFDLPGGADVGRTPTRSRCSSSTCWTSCRSRRSGSRTSRWDGSRRSSWRTTGRRGSPSW
ncbi:hypothetical protein [Blastococcus brunescens]|uniref:Lipoprotein n=1 Tax=Blastococcus brunescens TaxID=1564165 RepID=A0ABZ1B245_9ACTN|nr:hypothetical protein [Blastococcus sp. BMG 8361]WRL63100.1 hypothetical protein U6N30_25290 [Blastococcus sp. BMG 8361]